MDISILLPSRRPSVPRTPLCGGGAWDGTNLHLLILLRRWSGAGLIREQVDFPRDDADLRMRSRGPQPWTVDGVEELNRWPPPGIIDVSIFDQLSCVGDYRCPSVGIGFDTRTIFNLF